MKSVPFFILFVFMLGSLIFLHFHGSGNIEEEYVFEQKNTVLYPYWEKADSVTSDRNSELWLETATGLKIEK